MNISINENAAIKVEKIRSEFFKETGEELSIEDCIRLSVESLNEEVDCFGVGRMFLRKHLWEKSAVFINGKNKIIGSQC